MKKLLIFWLFAFSMAHSQTKYETECNHYLLENSLDSAIAQVGVLEKSNRNDGEKIKSYLSLFNLREGTPYCAVGVWRSFYTACLALNLSVSEIPIAKTPLANGMFNQAKASGIRTKFLAKRHDLIVWRKGKTPFGHIERIIETQKNGWVKTVAFNSSQIIDGKRREGVFIKRRNIYHPLARMAVRGLIGFRIKIV